MNYLKLYPLLTVFHKEAFWDRCCFLNILTICPLLFSEHSEVSLYADDTVLYCFSKEPHQLESKLNEDLYNVALWLKANKLTLNISKTKSMLIGSNKKLANVSSLSLSIFDCDLDSVNKFKYLGIMLASDFTLSDHVEYFFSKVNQRLGLLRRIKHLLPFTARLLFYNSLVLPVFDYGDLVWGDKNNVILMNDLQVLQKLFSIGHFIRQLLMPW